MSIFRRNRKLYLLAFGTTLIVLWIAFINKTNIINDDIQTNLQQRKYGSKSEDWRKEYQLRNMTMPSHSDEQHIPTFPPIKRQNDVCQPKQQILFLKTHKTGSSTVTSILQVYGYWRNLTFAVPKIGAQILSRSFFKAGQVHPGKYDMLVNHARYNRDEMKKVMKPGAKYITIIRDVSTQIESNFGYFRLVGSFRLKNSSNPFKTFLENPSYYWTTYRRSSFRNYMKNPNLFDLGLSETDQENVTAVERFITRISQEFDLVLIQEYFNESLLLLKKRMCWKLEDILYLSKGRRSSKIRYDIEQPLRASIRKWSWADVLLYDHFNKTFWKKIEEYGPSFNADLEEFHSKLNETLYNCTLPNARIRDNRRETSLRKNPKGSAKCADMMRSDLDFTKMLRRIQYGENINDTKIANEKMKRKKS